MKRAVTMALVATVIASFTLASSTAAQQWTGEIWHGRIQSVIPPNVKFERSDGQVVNVDIAQIHRDLIPTLAPGDMVTFAMAPAGPNQYVARLLLPDKLYMAAKDREWNHVRGQVQAVQGQQLTFRADDGRMLSVDMRQVDPEVQQAMRPGVSATVVGFPGPQPNQIEARYIQQHGAAASPRTGR